MGAPQIISIKEKRSATAARVFASTNCADYRKCRDKAAFANRQMQCHTCDRMKFERDHYLKEVGVHMVNHSDPGPCMIRIDGSGGAS